MSKEKAPKPADGEGLCVRCNCYFPQEKLEDDGYFLYCSECMKKVREEKAEEVKQRQHKAKEQDTTTNTHKCQSCEHLQAHGGHCERCHKNCVVPLSTPEGAFSTADVLLNPIIMPDRFGCGMKEGSIYYGVPVADREGKVLPAVYWNGGFVYGQEMLNGIGFNFQNLDLLTLETWDKKRLHAHIKNPTPAPTTNELLIKISELNKKYVYHSNENAHLVVAAYILLSYIYPIFSQCPRACFFGLAGSGKSTQTDLIAKLGLNPLVSADISKAGLFRTIEAQAGIVCVDNFDNISEEARNDFIQIYDTSFEANRYVVRVDKGDGKKMRGNFWRTYCPMAINYVNGGWMRASSISRTIFFPMIIAQGIKLEKLASANDGVLDDIKHELRVWACARHGQIGEIAKTIEGFANRDADIAKPLLAILQDAGEGQYKKGKTFLDANFAEYHREEDYSNDAITLNALLEVARNNYKAGKHVPVFVKEVAQTVLAQKGINERDERGEATRNYDRILQKECKDTGLFLKSTPFSEHLHPEGKSKFVFGKMQLLRFLRGRKIELGENDLKRFEVKLGDFDGN